MKESENTESLKTFSTFDLTKDILRCPNESVDLFFVHTLGIWILLTNFVVRKLITHKRGWEGPITHKSKNFKIFQNLASPPAQNFSIFLPPKNFRGGAIKI